LLRTVSRKVGGRIKHGRIHSCKKILALVLRTGIWRPR
jgi:hypothetical protein